MQEWHKTRADMIKSLHVVMSYFKTYWVLYLYISFCLPFLILTPCIPTHCRFRGYCCLWSHSNDTHTHSVRLLRTRDRPVAETSTWQNTTLTTDRRPRPPVGFEPAIPPSGRKQTHAFVREATGIGLLYFLCTKSQEIYLTAPSIYKRF
jgi:hypothetical protein